MYERCTGCDDLVIVAITRLCAQRIPPEPTDRQLASVIATISTKDIHAEMINLTAVPMATAAVTAILRRLEINYVRGCSRNRTRLSADRRTVEVIRGALSVVKC